jgi:hypothetical protein
MTIRLVVWPNRRQSGRAERIATSKPPSRRRFDGAQGPADARFSLAGRSDRAKTPHAESDQPLLEPLLAEDGRVT